MRPLVFHLADNTMVEGLKAFFRRDNWHSALDCEHYADLRHRLTAEGLWPAGSPKPSELKAACDRAARLGGSKSGRTVFRNVFRAVSRRSLDRCEEPGFKLLRLTLQTWFPKQKEAWEKWDRVAF